MVSGDPLLDSLPKAPTGITGFDEITGGGLPRGRPSLVCGGPGCGKTLFAMEFLVRGATQFGEPGVFIAFEESSDELARNVRSLGFDVNALVAQNQLAIDHVYFEPGDIQETGEFDLEGLFLRIGLAIDTVNAKRVVLDTIENLFGGLDGPILRSELRRLFRWLKDRGVTCIITGERGDGALTRQGLEEYVSDCVILLDHNVLDHVSTRRMRIVKYRGSSHGTNEYPFLVDSNGISILPVTSLLLNHKVTDERVSSGVPAIDTMLGGGGFYRGSSILLSGTAGTGKTTLAACFADAACRRGERCLYLAFEESQDQLVRNMRSIGLELGQWIDKGLLHFHASRPTLYGLEMHLATIHKLVDRIDPSAVVIDPVSNLTPGGDLREAQSMLLRLVDFLKSRGITAFLINLTNDRGALEQTQTNISSVVDTWVLLRDIELAGERNRGIYILKSRGMPHSNQIREFTVTSQGIRLVDVYSGPEGVLTGSMRLAQETRERAAERTKQAEQDRRRRDLARKRAVIVAQIAALNAELADTKEEEHQVATLEKREEADTVATRLSLSQRRRSGAGEVIERSLQRKKGAV